MAISRLQNVLRMKGVNVMRSSGSNDGDGSHFFMILIILILIGVYFYYNPTSWDSLLEWIESFN